MHIGLLIFFVIGYSFIIFEKFLHINKAAVALIMGVVSWSILYWGYGHGTIFGDGGHFEQHLGDVAEIIFFLLAAMVIVEIIDAHQGFKIITDIVYVSSPQKMMWFLLLIAFFMSSLLDNLTSMIVMTSLLKKLIKERQHRLFLGSILIIAVNAGGVWTPIGDVTTTMLWIHDKISTFYTIKMLFLPSITCLLVTGIIAHLLLRNKNQEVEGSLTHRPIEPGGRRVLFLGLGGLVMIPVWKAVFGLPPYLGALLGMGAVWLITDMIHCQYGQERVHLRVPHILGRIDTSGVLFFLGILLTIDALTVAGILSSIAEGLQHLLPSQNIVALMIGLVSSVVDNVPLVAATMKMYSATAFPQDAVLWQLIAYAAGTGGSILIIGSAAGVAFMGLEKVEFLWYAKKVGWIALLAYFAGAAVYFAQMALVG